MLDRFVMDCPRCGKVEGFIATDTDEDTPPDSPDEEVEEQTFESVHGPVTRVRCPRCSQWLDVDREHPPD